MGGREVWLFRIRLSGEHSVIGEAENLKVAIMKVKIVILILISGVERCEEVHATSYSNRK